MIFVALALVSSVAPGDIVIIARDGADSVSAIEAAALTEASPQALKRLADDGYLIAEIDKGVTLAIDPTAPPLGPIVAERLLLQAFGDMRSPKSFEDLDAATRRVIADTIGTFHPDRVPTANTKFMVRAEARFNLQVPGRSGTYTATYRLAGPSDAELTVVKSAPLRKLDRNDEPRSKSVQDRHSAEMMDNIMPWVNLSWRGEIYRKCQERLLKQLDTELEARKEVLIKAIKQLPNPPNATTSAGDVPPRELDAMKRNFEQSWMSLGYSSREAASAAWGAATWGAADVAFTLYFGDTLSDTGSQMGIFGVEFGRGGR